MLTAEQRIERNKYACSSDAAAIVGLDPWQSAADVWLEKTGRTTPAHSNKDKDRGNLLEPVVLDWAQQQIGQPFLRNVMLVHPVSLLAANYDAIGNDFHVEAKTSTLADEWGEEGTDEVPERVIVQVHHAMYVAGAAFRVAYVPVLLPVFRRFDFRLYVVQRDEALCTMIADACCAFMAKVKADEPVSDFKPSLEVVKRIRRQPNKVIEIESALVAEWRDKSQRARDASKEADAAEAALLAKLGDAEAASCDLGLVTYYETRRKAYAVDATRYRQLKLRATR